MPTKKIEIGKAGFERPLFSWQSPEFVHYKREPKKVLLATIFATVFCLLLIWQQQWSGVALIVIAYFALLVISGTKPKVINCAIYQEGITVEKKVYSFDQFKNFWLTFSDIPKIKFQMAGALAGQVTMPLGEEDAEQIRLFLSKRIPEEADKGEDLIDMINHFIRF